MSTFKTIRTRLGLTQAAIADELGVSQGNVSFYENKERPQPVPPKVAEKLIAAAASRGLAISFDHIYGAADLPAPEAAPAEQGA